MEKLLSKVVEYVAEFTPNFRKDRNGTFTCPICGELSCHPIFKTYRLNCLNCQTLMGDITDLVRLLEPEKKDWKKDDIVFYLKNKYSIDILTNKEVDKALELYTANHFDLVPVVRNSKIPIEKDWLNKPHLDKVSWEEWLKDGLNIGIKTGKLSNITVVDIDTKEVNPELAKLLNPTLVQETTKGHHHIYQYEPTIPTTRIDEMKVDILNNGKQFVAYPSVVDNIRRRILDYSAKVEKMSPELLKFLTQNTVPTPKTFSEKIETEILENTPLNIDLNSIEEGSRTHFLMRMGGILRKQLNSSNTSYTLSLINNNFCKPPLPDREFRNIANSLDKYIMFDDQDLSHKVFTYLKIVEECTARDVKEALGETKEKIDKALAFLVKEGYVVKKQRMFIIVRHVEWKDTFQEDGAHVKFTVPYFDDVASFRSGDMILVGGQQKIGKCFGVDTEILLYNGNIKKVQDIVTDDIIMGDDNTPRHIKGLVRGREPLYKLIYNKHSVIVSENHLLVLQHLDKTVVDIISVKDFIKKSDWYKKRSRLISSPIELQEKELELSPYFLGLWLGDGSSYNVGITTADSEIVTFLKNYARMLGLQLTIKDSKTTIAKSYSITSGKVGGDHKEFSLYRILKDLNLLQNKHIPIKYLTSSKLQRTMLLAGLIDSDGYKVSERILSFSNKNVKLIEGVEYLSRSLGYRTTRESKNVNNETYYSVRIIGNTCELPLAIPRKQSRKTNSFKKERLYSFKIEPIGIGDYYGFELDGNHRFLTADFIVHHNSHIALNIVKQLVEQGIKPYYINLESGNRFASIARALGLKEGDFWHATHFAPEQVELEKDAVTILDWLLPKDYADTDKLFQYFAHQLVKNGGLLYVFAQLKENKDFFAKNMVSMFPALVSRYFYNINGEGEDVPTEGYFQVDYIREPKMRGKHATVPCRYDWDTKRLNKVEMSILQDDKGDEEFKEQVTWAE